MRHFSACFSDFRLWCLVGAAVLAAAALTKPTVRMDRSVYRYFIVFDITQSQNAEDEILDGTPVSRLAFAKHAARAALRDLPCGSSLGVGLFASYDIVPLFSPIEACRNFSAIDQAIEAIDWRMGWDGSSNVVIGLYAAIEKAKAMGSRTRIIFFTDGDQFPRTDTDTVSPFSGKKGEVAGLLVGVGGLAPAKIPKFDNLGNRKGFLAARSRLDESFLRKLEKETGLTYVRLESAKQFSAALRAAEFADKEEVDVDVRLPLGALALLLTLIAVLL